MAWETVIGLEVHIQLATQSKIFSTAPTAYGAEPNTQASAVDIALPGVLPVINGQVIRMATLFGLAIAGWLAWGAWRGASDAVDDLMDREWPDEKRQAFVEAAARHPELSNLHDLRTRTSGNRDFVQFHVDLPPALTIAAAHAIIDRVEADLLEQFPGTELLIHIDPEGHVDEPDNPLVEDNEFAKLEKDA